MRTAFSSSWLLYCFYLVFIALPNAAFADTSSVDAVNSSKNGLAQPDYSIYHTLNGVFSEVESTVQRCKHIMSIEERSMTADDYTSTMKIITVEFGGITTDHSKKARLLINFGEHGRELISPEIALRLLAALCDDNLRAELLKEYNIDASLVEQVLQNVVFKIVPVENPGGRELVEGGALCERKNGRGVDPNRNWEVHWGFKERDYDPDEEYPGTKPFSEPEASMLRWLAEQFEPHLWLNVHSGMEAMFVPYDHKNEVPEGPEAAATLKILEDLNRDMCKGECAVGPGGKTVGYFAHGTATDYMHDELRVGLVMTWEVYGDNKASFLDCFRMFNPLTRDGYEKVVKQWTASIFGLLAALPGHPAVHELDALGKSVDRAEERGVWGRKGGMNSNGGQPRNDNRSTSKSTSSTSNTSGKYLEEYIPSSTDNAAGYVVLGLACIAFAVYVARTKISKTISFGRFRGIGRRRERLPL